MNVPLKVFDFQESREICDFQTFLTGHVLKLTELDESFFYVKPVQDKIFLNALPTTAPEAVKLV